jgi:DNA-binding MarR family transcriptional regulator
MELLTQTYQEQISFSLSCYDRIIITGRMPEISYAQGMTSYLYQHKVRIFDYPRFAEPFKDIIKANAQRLAQEQGCEIEFIRKKSVRKEDLIKQKVAQRGAHPGLVHILAAMEQCPTYQPWHDKHTGHTFLKPAQSKCLTYYFYFIDDLLGLGYIRVPTWCPFNLQVYFNGHNLLSNQLTAANIPHTMLDNAFDSIADVAAAQRLADEFPTEQIHRKLDYWAWRCCPLAQQLQLRYHWTITQAEYATDIVFKQQQDLQALYGELIKTAIHTVQPENIATFLGRKLDARYQGEAGNNYHVRLTGSRIKHQMGTASIKMYDKFQKILRLETTANDVTFFQHYREVVHRDGTKSKKIAPLKKSIYSLPLLQDNLRAANRRYLEFISAFANKQTGYQRLEKITQPTEVDERRYPGFNFFAPQDVALLQALLRGEFTIQGFRNKGLRQRLDYNSNKVSRLLKRLWTHGLIKKARGCYKYYVTKLGQESIIMAEKLKELVIVPAFAY